jgi:tRNA (guanine-N7-)-methyltransferase
MFTYTLAMIAANRLPVLLQTDDLYHSLPDSAILSIRTFYEQQWLKRGLNIKYIQFVCEARDEYLEPEVDIEPDPYRSFSRSQRTEKHFNK